VKKSEEVFNEQTKLMTKVETEQRHPRCIQSNKICQMELSTKNGDYICLDKFKNSKIWGRFVMRESGSTVASGMVIDWVNE